MGIRFSMVNDAGYLCRFLVYGAVMKLEVDKSYINRRGTRVKIVYEVPHKAMPFLDDRNYWYAPNGAFSAIDEAPSPFDLIAEWEEPKQEVLTNTDMRALESASHIVQTATGRMALVLTAIDNMTDTERNAALGYLNARFKGE